MSLLVRFLGIGFLLWGQPWAYGQIAGEYRFEMDGVLPRTEEEVLPATRFNVKWNEVNGEIRGIYADNYFATTAVPVTGESGGNGRRFTAVFPEVSRGVKNIDIRAPRGSEGAMDISFNLKNAAGVILNHHELQAVVSSDPTAAEVADAADPQIGCVVGMGALAGYCGMYTGTVTKEIDGAHRCRELVSSSSRLELNSVGDFRLHLENIYTVAGPTSLNPDLYIHELGSLNGAGPVGMEVNVARRHCDELMGVSFPREDCKDLRLQGSFASFAGVQSFRGTYTITHSESGENCSFGMMLEKQD